MGTSELGVNFLLLSLIIYGLKPYLLGVDRTVLDYIRFCPRLIPLGRTKDIYVWSGKDMKSIVEFCKFI